jgi:hypothetical protein
MAIKKPIVLTNGELEQLQPGDRVQTVVVFNRQNANTGNLVICTPIYASGAGQINKAQADSASTKNVLGLVADNDIAPSANGAVQSDGIFEATTTQWDAVTGDTDGLTVGSKYYLDDATAGQLTDTLPTTQGNYIVPIGIALSTTELEITIGPTIKL